MNTVLGQIDKEHAKIRADQKASRPDAAPDSRRRGGAKPSELLDLALHQASGTGGKQPARIDVISPLLLAETKTHTVEQMLSGELLFHFGGFLDETMRRNDFDLGYKSTLAWLDAGGLDKLGLSKDKIEIAKAAANDTDNYKPRDGWRKTGDTTVGSLLAMHPWQTAQLAGQIVRVLHNDIHHHDRP